MKLSKPRGIEAKSKKNSEKEKEHVQSNAKKEKRNFRGSGKGAPLSGKKELFWQ